MTKKEKILVTGGAGYIGSHMVHMLCDLGYCPIVVDNLSSGEKSRIPASVPLHVFDIGDSEKLNYLIASEKIDVVMHFAAFIKVGESVDDPAKYYHNNVMNMLVLLNAMRKNKVNKIIFSSTAATFGNPVYIPVDEKHPQQPINPYGKSKLMCEQMLKDFDFAYGIKSVCLRYFNAAGADPQLRTGFHKQDAANLIPIILRVASGETAYLSVFGNDYDTKDGSCVRDYIHILDLCQAHLLAMQHLLKNGESRSYNLGNGVGYSVYEVVSAVETVTGKKITIKNEARRMGDSASLTADSTLIRKELMWEPMYPELGKIVKDAWRWKINEA